MYQKISLALMISALSVSALANQKPESMWQEAVALSNADFTSSGLSDSTTNVVFIRPVEANSNANSSINIAINDRYLTSLHSGRYTNATVCSFGTTISAYPTAAKSNDLLANAQTVNLTPRQTSFFLVQGQPNGAPSLAAIDARTAQQLLQNTSRQNHQISRVSADNCQAPVVVNQPVEPLVFAGAFTVEQQPSFQSSILFDNNKSKIKSTYQGEIAEAAQFLENYPNTQAIVEGHTDSNGSVAYNQALSQRRAEAARQALIKHQVPASRIQTVAYGEQSPVATNSTAEGRQQNRRVVITIPNQ